MPKFTYKGEDAHGKVVTQTVTAKDRFSVYEIARSDGHTVTSISDEGRFSIKQWLDIEKINYYLNRVSQDELVMVTRNLGSMINAGLTVSRALSVIERQTTNPRLKGIIHQIIERINQGDQFQVALGDFPKVFDDLYRAMIKAGEESGNLSDTLLVLAKQMEQSSNLKKKIKGAMIYPAIVITVMVIIAILMMIYVMPQIIKVFEKADVELPVTTRVIIAATNFMNDYTVLAIGGLLGAVAAVVYFFRTDIGKKLASFVIPRLPVIGTMAKEVNSARTARTLSSLLHSGVDVIQSLEITHDVVQNYYYKQIIWEARQRVEKGTPLSETFIERIDLYPVLVGEMILVGEETGQIAQMMSQLAEFYETEVERKTKDLSTIIEPLLMVVIGSGVGFFALAMIAPIYGISKTIK